MNYSLKEAINELRNTKKSLNEGVDSLSWVERIQKLIAEKKLDPLTLEEFISEHENIDVAEMDGPNLDDKRFDYKDEIKDEIGYDGWFRTDMFDSYPYPYPVLLKHLKDDKWRLGYDWFIVDSDGNVILIRDSRALRDWFETCDFKNKQEAIDFLESHDNNISLDYVDDYFGDEEE